VLDNLLSRMASELALEELENLLASSGVDESERI
jgi:hypothetical protein